MTKSNWHLNRTGMSDVETKAIVVLEMAGFEILEVQKGDLPVPFASNG